MPKSPDMRYRLFNESCFETFKRIASDSIDLVLVDPPYGSLKFKWDSVIELAPMWEELLWVVKPTTPLVFMASQPFTSVLVASQLSLFKYCLVWDRNVGLGFLDAKFRPLKCHEDIVVFSRGGCSNGSNPAMTYYPQDLVPSKPSKHVVTKAKGVYQFNSQPKQDSAKESMSGYPKSILAFGRDRPQVHPTQKPLALMEWLVKTYSSEGGTVLDFAMGSGTTGVACGRLKRRFIGCDNNPDYFQIAEQRIVEAYAQTTSNSPQPQSS